MSEFKMEERSSEPGGTTQQFSSIQKSYSSAPYSGNKRSSSRVPVLYIEEDSFDDLIKKAEGSLEIEFWPGAMSYAERAQALEPHNTRAYVCMMLADLKCKNIDDIKFLKSPIDSNQFYRQLLILGDEELKRNLAEANNYICSRLRDSYQGELDQIKHDMDRATIVPDLIGAEKLLETLPVFSDSVILKEKLMKKKHELIDETMSRAEKYAQHYNWTEAIDLLESVSFEEKARMTLLDYRRQQEIDRAYIQSIRLQEKYDFRGAADIFSTLGNYRDSQERLKKCRRMIKGNKVRAVGRKHTCAVWVNVFLSAFLALGCFVSAPTHILISFLWGIPLCIFTVIMTIIHARYRPTKRMWIVMAVVLSIFIILTAINALPFSQSQSLIPSIVYLVLMLCSIFV